MSESVEDRKYQKNANRESQAPDPEGPCTQIVDKLAPKYPNRDYFKAKVYTIWVHGPLG